MLLKEDFAGFDFLWVNFSIDLADRLFEFLNVVEELSLRLSEFWKKWREYYTYNRYRSNKRNYFYFIKEIN